MQVSDHPAPHTSWSALSTIPILDIHLQPDPLKHTPQVRFSL